MSNYSEQVENLAGLATAANGVSAEQAVRMRLQNQFKTGLDVARYTADIMRRDLDAYDADTSQYTQSLGCWHGFIGQQKMIAIKKREREIADQNLMRLYGAPGDVIRARDAKISSIVGMIETHEGTIIRLQNQKRQQESALADIERAGGVIGKDGLARISSLENRIAQIESEIAKKEDEKGVLSIAYAEDLKCVKEMYER